MSIYKNIEAILNESASWWGNYDVINSTILDLKKTNKLNIALKMQSALKLIVVSKLNTKKNLICAILGISEIEFKELISKTTHIKKLNCNKYLFLENNFKLKEFSLHSNSIKEICSLMNIQLIC